MTVNKFGGRWTAAKLDVLREYLAFYATALSRQPYELVYIDAFAGTGRCQIKVRGTAQTIDGSATIAMNSDPGFSRYFFIESKPRKARELQRHLASHPKRARASIANGNAVEALPGLLTSIDWRRTRGVLFLDPFGLQCTWTLLEEIQRTEALDVVFMVSLAGLFRQAAIAIDDVDETKAARLTAFLGTEAWRSHLYKPAPQGVLFGQPPPDRREPGWQDILDFMSTRLAGLFPYVSAPKLLLMDTPPVPLFALYVAVSNRSASARRLAADVSTQILSKLRL